VASTFPAPPTRAAASRIAILPPELADQIAAGEVVERAASAVKELCENAIDAGARHVDVDIEGGGLRLIRVVDDGSGMTAPEARLALRRHATSKIARAEDLWTLKSFGFRGEALPSIAAVSRLTLSTRVAGASSGYRLSVDAGVETDAREVGMPTGTRVEVRDLFFNTPARLKFQKSEATEAGNATDAVLRLALGHPECHFRMSVGGRLSLDLPPHRDRAERVRAALARRGLGALHEVLGEEGGHRVHAFLAGPSQATSTARSAFLFVGRRFVRDRSLLHAVVQGYGDALERGRYPLAVLFLEVPGSDLDVNVHPQKLEVRFARAAEVYAAVRHVVREGLARAPWSPGGGAVGSDPGANGGGAGASSGGARGRVMPFSPPPPEPLSARAPLSSGAGPTRGHRGAPRGPAWAEDDRADDDRGFVSGGGGEPLRWGSGRAADATDLPARRDSDQRELRLLGQLDVGCWVCAAEEALVLYDPHTVRELGLLRALGAELAAGEVRGQKLLFPIPIEWRPSSSEGGLADATSGSASIGVVEALRAIGVDVEPPRVGRGVWVLHAVPALLAEAAPKPLLVGLLERWAVSPPPAPEELLGVMACAASVRPGDDVDAATALEWLEGLNAPPPHRGDPSGVGGPAPDIAADTPVGGAVARGDDRGFVCRRGRPLCLPITFEALRAHFGRA
jgi:DNA mismatch repair protein MutL